MNISLADILEFENPEDYKVHLATWNGKNQPLNVFVSDPAKWENWNSYRGVKDDFSRKYIFSLMDFYHEPDNWLFGGCYEVVKRLNKTKGKGYEVELTDQFEPFIGRLKLKWKRTGRAKARRLENCIDKFEVSEILTEKYTGEAFCGYENINHDFDVLENIFLAGKPDWMAALADK